MAPFPLRNRTEQYVKETLAQAEAGHDWWHVDRVRRMALHLSALEGGNTRILELAALLHDIADAKFHDGDEELGARRAGHFLAREGLSANEIRKVQELVRRVSFKGGLPDDLPINIELKILQDADRLDALGAIGIARTFHYGGYKNRPLYDPAIPPREYQSAAAYRASQAPTINHFYEKLLRLKDGMHTATARKIAAQRHAFMEQFLEQFYREWEGPS